MAPEYNMLVLARRKAGITHAYFRERYEQHMAMVERLVGADAMPLRHTRRYVAQPARTAAGPGVAALDYDVVVDMAFADEAAWARFRDALARPDAARAVADDEAGFWDRADMSVAVVDEVCETVQTRTLC